MNEAPIAAAAVKLLAREGHLPVLAFASARGPVAWRDLQREFPACVSQLPRVLAALVEAGWLVQHSELVWGVHPFAWRRLEAAWEPDPSWAQVPAGSWSLEDAVWEAENVGLVAPRESQLLLLARMLRGETV